MARSGAATDRSLKVMRCKPLFIYDLPEFNCLPRPADPEGDETHARTYQVRREGAVTGRQRRLGSVQRLEQDQTAPVLHARVVGQAAAEILREDQTAAGVAAGDRLALPDL